MAYYGGKANVAKDSETTINNEKRETFLLDMYHQDLVDNHGSFVLLNPSNAYNTRGWQWQAYRNSDGGDLSRSYGFIYADF